MSTEMEIPSMEENTSIEVDRDLLLMAPMGSNGHEHIINLITDNASSISSSSDQPFMQHPLQLEDPTDQSYSAVNRRNISSSLFIHRGDGYGHHYESSDVSFPCLSKEIIVISSQIILSSLILLLARDDDIPTSLFTWVKSYTFGCVAMLPTLLWRLWNREWDAGQIPSTHRVTSENNHLRTNRNQLRGLLSMLFDEVMDHFKIAADFIFAWWFIIGDICFFEDSPPTQTAAIFRVLITFLALSCIYYSMPIALFAIVYFCWSPVAHVISFSEDHTHARSRVARSEKFNSLTRYKVMKMLCGDGNSRVLGAIEGLILAVGKEKVRTIPEEDAFCCICLNEYADNDELTELPCFHVFHMECADKWLKINAVCPLCRNEVWPLEEQ